MQNSEYDHAGLSEASEDFANACHAIATHKMLPSSAQAGQFNFGKFVQNFAKLAGAVEPVLEVAVPYVTGPTGAILTELLPLLKKLGGAGVTPTGQA